MKISIIAAVDEKRGIGKNNGLLLSLPEDMQRFRDVTRGHPVIMGRRTFESKEIRGKPLPNRLNIVISRNPSIQQSGILREKDTPLYFVLDLDKGIEIAKEWEEKANKGNEEIFVIGGGQIYHQAIVKADRLYLTLLEGDFEADTFFPDYSMFKKVIFEEEHESGGYKYKFLTLER